VSVDPAARWFVPAQGRAVGANQTQRAVAAAVAIESSRTGSKVAEASGVRRALCGLANVQVVMRMNERKGRHEVTSYFHGPDLGNPR
jgi:hypothetical protein